MVKEQIVLSASNEYREIDDYIKENHISAAMLVCGNSINSLKIGKYFEKLAEKINIIKFSDFTPNPLYESVVKGVEIFNENKCQMIIAVGGGSAMDVAKCIKLYANMSHDKLYLEQEIIPNDIRFMAVPTTAGTGSEATRYAVIYYNGEKQSVADYSCIPDMVVMDSSTIKSLPDYHKKATMLDALCHAIEAFWSVNSTDESKRYSAEAIKLIMQFKDSYLRNEDEGNEKMLLAANLAGKAINITQTTAGHAMCYKLTSLFGIAHGHAAALCVPKLWRYMIANTDKCIDLRGSQYLEQVFADIAKVMGANEAVKAVDKYEAFLSELGLETPKIKDNECFDILKKSVNPVRLKNNPVKLDEEVIDTLYHQILTV